MASTPPPSAWGGKRTFAQIAAKIPVTTETVKVLDRYKGLKAIGSNVSHSPKASERQIQEWVSVHISDNDYEVFHGGAPPVIDTPHKVHHIQGTCTYVREHTI